MIFMTALYTMDTFHSVMLSHTYISDRQRGKGHRRNDALPRLLLQLSDYLIKNTAIAQANTNAAQAELSVCTVCGEKEIGKAQGV